MLKSAKKETLNQSIHAGEAGSETQGVKMHMRTMMLLIGAQMMALAQMPDREVLVEQLKDPATSQQAFADLVVHYQLGGVRSILRNLNELPNPTRLAYGQALLSLDLFRFRNDLNANLTEATDPEAKALFLQMLATCGRQLDSAVFDPYIDNEDEDIRVRLAAVSGPIKIQNPTYYDKFFEVAKKASFDPSTGRDDFKYADIDMSNQGFYYYTRGKIASDGVSDVHVYTAIRMAGPASGELFTTILDLKWKKFVPLMIDRAVRVGAPALLDVMADHKTAKKFKDEIAKARPAAATIATYLNRGPDFNSKDQYPIAAALPRNLKGTGDDGLAAGYGIVKIAADGSSTLVEHMAPFAGNESLKADFSNYHAIPAFVNFSPVESFAWVTSP